MGENQDKTMLAQVTNYLNRNEDVPEFHLRWAATYLNFGYTPTQQEVRAELVRRGLLDG